MKAKQDEIDAEKEAKLQAQLKATQKQSHFLRLIRMSQPKINIVIGFIVSIAQGSLMPWFGILMGKMLFVLNGYYVIIDHQTIEEGSNKYCLHMLIAAIIAFCTGFT